MVPSRRVLSDGDVLGGTKICDGATMRWTIGLTLVLAIWANGCSPKEGEGSPPVTSQPSSDAKDSWRDASPGANVYTFDESKGQAYKRCTESAPPQIGLELQAHPPGKAPVAIAIDLYQGPNDRVPTEIEVGTNHDRCDPGCSGKVFLDELVPGKHMRVRIDLVWPDGHIARQRLVVPWSGNSWEVRACPGPPDAYPR